MKSIKLRLTAGLGLVIVFFLLQMALVWWGQDTTRRDVVDATRKNTVASAQLGDLAVMAQQVRRYEKEYFVYVGNKERRDAYIKEWGDTTQKITKLLQSMRTNDSAAFTKADMVKVEDWLAASDFYSFEMRKIFESVNVQSEKLGNIVLPDASALAATLVPSAKPLEPKLSAATAVLPSAMFTSAEVNEMITAGKNRFSGVLIKGVSDMRADKTKQTLALSDLANDGFNQLLYAVMATVGVGIAVAAGLIVMLPRAVTQPLAMLTQSVDNISKGQLDSKVDLAGVAEFDSLAKALERLRLSQQALLARMRRG